MTSNDDLNVEEQPKQLQKSPSNKLLMKGTTASVCPRTKEGTSQAMELTIEIVGDKIQLIAFKDGIYFEGKESFLNEGDIVNIVNQVPFMSENENYSLIFRYEGFPPIQLLKSEKKASDIEKQLKVNNQSNHTQEQYQNSLKDSVYQPEVIMTTEQLNESISNQYQKDIKERHLLYQKAKDAVQADILQIQSEIDQMERKLKDEKDLEGIKTQKFRLDVVRRENSRIEYYITQLDYWKNYTGRLNQVQYLRMMHSFVSTDYKDAMYRQLRQQYDFWLGKLLIDLRRSRLRKNQKEYDEFDSRVIQLGKDYRALEELPFFKEQETYLVYKFLSVDETLSFNELIEKQIKEIQQQKDSVSELQVVLVEKQKEINDARLLQAEMNQAVQEQAKQIEELTTKNNELSQSADEATKWKKKYEKISVLLENMQEKHQARIETIEALVCTKDKSIKSLKEQIVQKVEQIDLLSKSTMKDERLRAYQIDLSKSQQKCLILQAKKDKYKQQNKQQQRKIIKLEEYVTGYKSELGIIRANEERVKEGLQQIEAAKSNNLLNEQALQKNKFQIQQLKQSIKNLEGYLDEDKNEFQKQEERIINFEGEIERLKKEIQKKMAEITNLKLQQHNKNF